MNRRLIVVVTLIALTVAALFITFATLKPTPPRMIVMSTGPAGSAYAIYAEQYKTILAEDGIELELRPSEGVLENLNRLNDPDGDVSIAFATLGIKVTEDAKDLESLGTVFFEPIWFFFRNPEISRANIQAALGDRLSIGLPGSVTNIAARRLLDLNGIDTDIIELLNLEPHDAVERLKAGTVDSAVFVNAASTPLITDLLATEGITLANF